MKLEAGGRIWAKNKFLYPRRLWTSWPPRATSASWRAGQWCRWRAIKSLLLQTRKLDNPCERKQKTSSYWVFFWAGSGCKICWMAPGPRQLMGQWVCTCPACPYTLARPAVGARWVGGRWRWWGSSVVPPGTTTATSQSPDGSTPSTLCRGSRGAAVFLVLSGRKASVYPKNKKFSWMAKHEDRLYSQFSAQNIDGQTIWSH